MARYTCPSCGASYNGKVCRSCSYEHFSEEIAHGLHTHEGEPLVVKTPEERPVPRMRPDAPGKRPRPCSRKTRRSSRRFRIALVIFAVIVAFNFLVTFVHFAVDTVYSTNSLWDLLEGVEPEPEVVTPENTLLLHEEGGIRIYADLQGNFDGSEFPIYVENDHSYDIPVFTRNLTVNGFLMESVGFYCDAFADSTTSASFCLYEDDLETAGISQIQTVTFQLEAYDEDYATLFTSDPITLEGNADPGYIQPTDLGGTPVFRQDGIQISYLGYLPDEYSHSPDAFIGGTLQFYLVNETDRTLQFYTQKALLADGKTEVFLWEEIPPQTRAVVNIYLYGSEYADIPSPEAAFPMELTMEISDPEDSDFRLVTDTVVLPL